MQVEPRCVVDLPFHLERAREGEGDQLTQETREKSKRTNLTSSRMKVGGRWEEKAQTRVDLICSLADAGERGELMATPKV